MGTLIKSGKGDSRDRRCDAKCYDAKDPVCDCVCGGMNHGVGREKAEGNTRDLAGAIIDSCGGSAQAPLFQL